MNTSCKRDVTEDAPMTSEEDDDAAVVLTPLTSIRVNSCLVAISIT